MGSIFAAWWTRDDADMHAWLVRLLVATSSLGRRRIAERLAGGVCTTRDLMRQMEPERRVRPLLEQKCVRRCECAEDVSWS